MSSGGQNIRQRGKEDDGGNTQLYVLIRHAGKGVSRRCLCVRVSVCVCAHARDGGKFERVWLFYVDLSENINSHLD